jgi:hypothetical protein
MTWACWMCGRELRASTERANCQCGESFVLAMVPVALVNVEPGMPRFNHGAVGYDRFKCRCDKCTVANRLRHRKLRGVA